MRPRRLKWWQGVTIAGAVLTVLTAGCGSGTIRSALHGHSGDATAAQSTVAALGQKLEGDPGGIAVTTAADECQPFTLPPGTQANFQQPTKGSVEFILRSTKGLGATERGQVLYEWTFTVGKYFLPHFIDQGKVFFACVKSHLPLKGKGQKKQFEKCAEQQGLSVKKPHSVSDALNYGFDVVLTCYDKAAGLKPATSSASPSAKASASASASTAALPAKPKQSNLRLAA